MGVDAFEEQVTADQELLASFGLRLLAISGGLTVAFENELKGEKINPWNCSTIDSKLFEWLQPLLTELAECREVDG